MAKNKKSRKNRKVINLAAKSSTDFKEKENNAKANYTPTGKSGTLVSSEVIDNDYLRELTGVEGQETFAKMLLSDAQIRKLVHAVQNPIKSAKWTVEPASEETKDIEIAALMEQILFRDLPDGWAGKLDEILTFPWHGHAVFEVVHKNRESKEFGMYTGLSNLAFRDQRTLDKWKFSSDGILETIHQKQAGDIPVDADMSVDNLIIFYNEKKGNDNGYAFCRMFYGNYKRKLLYKQLQAIGIEKGAIGVPIVGLPQNIDYESDEYAVAIEQLELYTQAENAYMVRPFGYEIELDQSNNFDPSKVQVAIKAENEEISGSLVAMWLEMGIGGNSAVGSSTGISADFFRDGIEYLADKIADTINIKLIPNLVMLNFGEVDKLPELKHNGIADEAGKELMEVVTGYTNAGVISADEPLEDHIRKQHNLPKKAEGEIIDNKATQNDKDPTPNGDDDSNVSGNDDDADETKDLSEKVKTPRGLIQKQASVISDDIRKTLSKSSAKYINDVMAKYKKLGKNKKQNATNDVVMSGKAELRKALRRDFTETSQLSITQAKGELNLGKEVRLSSSDAALVRLTEKYGDYSEIKLNDFSTLPTHIQVLIAKQADLISTDSVTELKKKIDFAFSGVELNTVDENVIRQTMEDSADKFTESAQVNLKGANSASLMTNESRNALFFSPEVIDEVASFTFINNTPKSAICKELAGITIKANDAESLYYAPPLHHNCKSYLRANLKTSKGVDQLDVSTWSPSADAKKVITL